MSKTKPVIFLDFDGVIINERSLKERRPLSQKADPDCVAALNRITEETGAVIVVSSAWRLDFSLEELSVLLRGWGVSGYLAGKTPILGRDTVRGDEIAHWMKAEDVDSANVVILDDDQDMGALSPRLIRTDARLGLTMQEAQLAIYLLKTGGEHRDPPTLAERRKRKAPEHSPVMAAAADVVSAWERRTRDEDPAELDIAIVRLRLELWRIGEWTGEDRK